VDGADGLYRVTPNFVVVVPTQDTVTLYRTRTASDWTGLFFGLLGIAGLVWLIAIAARARTRSDVEA
jgi:hypothetical protein